MLVSASPIFPPPRRARVPAPLREWQPPAKRVRGNLPQCPPWLQTKVTRPEEDSTNARFNSKRKAPPLVPPPPLVPSKAKGEDAKREEDDGVEIDASDGKPPSKRQRLQEATQDEVANRLASMQSELATARDQCAAAQRRIKVLEREIPLLLKQRGQVGLVSMSIVQNVFIFLRDPADVLRASATCHRWRELACADAVWGRGSMATDAVRTRTTPRTSHESCTNLVQHSML